MSDVLQLASKYRSRLKAELSKVEDFLRMAEELSKGGDLEGRLPFTKPNGEAQAKPAAEGGQTGPKAEAAPKAEAKAKPAEEEAKTPFDRFRASGG